MTNKNSLSFLSTIVVDENKYITNYKIKIEEKDYKLTNLIRIDYI